MATINFTGNSYAGEVLEDLLVYTAKGNDTYREGLIHIKPGVQKRFVLPHLNLGNIIQDNVATPAAPDKNGISADSVGQYTHSERYLEPKDFMVYVEFNPRDYEDYWRFAQPEGALVFRELDPKLQMKMLHLLIDKKDEYIGDCIWGALKGGANPGVYTSPEDATVLGGESAAGPMKYFDGAIARVLANVAAQNVAADKRTDEQKNEVASGAVVVAGNTELTDGAAVEKALYAMWAKCPKNVRKSNALKFVMGWEAWDMYEQYLTSKEVKYVENPEINKFKFKGKRIIVINGMPEHTIFLGKFSEGADSCLWMGVDYATDQESIKVDRLQANSELYFFQMRMKVDVNLVLPGEIVVWTAYKHVA
jgi:hypothetical protein